MPCGASDPHRCAALLGQASQQEKQSPKRNIDTRKELRSEVLAVVCGHQVASKRSTRQRSEADQYENQSHPEAELLAVRSREAEDRGDVQTLNACAEEPVEAGHDVKRGLCVGANPGENEY